MDSDARVRGPALEALAHVGSPDLSKRLFEALEAPDFVVRATAAGSSGRRSPAGGADGSAPPTRAAGATRLCGARGRARGARALRPHRSRTAPPTGAGRPRVAGAARGPPSCCAGWASRGRCRRGPRRCAQPAEFFESAALLHPTFSPHAFIETRYGTIELELNVVEAPLTTRHFVDLARAGFFNGVHVHRLVPNFVVQAGDPRGDGEGGRATRSRTS